METSGTIPIRSDLVPSDFRLYGTPKQKLGGPRFGNVWDHPTYSFDFVPLHFRLFRAKNQTLGSRLQNIEWLWMQESDFYNEGKFNFVPQGGKCI